MRIAIVSKASFPDGEAAASYVLNVARTLRRRDNEIFVFGSYHGDPTAYPQNGIYDGICYNNYNSVESGKVKNYIFTKKWSFFAKRWLDSHDVDIVLLYGGLASEASDIYAYCQKKGKKYIAFNAEWYTEESFASDAKKKYIQDKIGLIPFNAKNAHAAIVISSLLRDFFLENGTPSIMIPNIVDLSEDKWNCRKNFFSENLILSYAGMPGIGKDELATIIAAVELAKNQLHRNIEFHIYGPDTAALKKYLVLVNGNDYYDEGTVFCHGRIRQEEIPAALVNSHFTVLIRKPSKRANAGFSTKMVESFSAGVPLIANITGDMGDYIVDNRNGIISTGWSVEECKNAIIRAYQSLDRNAEMRIEAYRTAQKHFDYRKYIGPVGEFLNNI